MAQQVGLDVLHNRCRSIHHLQMDQSYIRGEKLFRDLNFSCQKENRFFGFPELPFCLVQGLFPCKA